MGQMSAIEDDSRGSDGNTARAANRMPYVLILISMFFLVDGANSIINMTTRRAFDFGFGIAHVVIGIGLLRLSETARKGAVILLSLSIVVGLLLMNDILFAGQRPWGHISFLGRRLPELSEGIELTYVGSSTVILLLATVALSRSSLRRLFSR